jgi:hypothetical protein
VPSPLDAVELQAHFVTADSVRKATEIEWGAERLVALTPDDLRVKFLRQRMRLRLALEAAGASDVVTGPQMEAVRKAAAGVVAGYEALVTHAVEAGHRPLRPEVWEHVMPDGQVLVVVRDNDAAALVLADARAKQVYTLQEVAAVIDALPAALRAAKVEFPGARIELPLRDRATTWSDEIPF